MCCRPNVITRTVFLWYKCLCKNVDGELDLIKTPDVKLVYETSHERHFANNPLGKIVGVFFMLIVQTRRSKLGLCSRIQYLMRIVLEEIAVKLFMYSMWSIILQLFTLCQIPNCSNTRHFQRNAVTVETHIINMTRGQSMYVSSFGNCGYSTIYVCFKI